MGEEKKADQTVVLTNEEIEKIKKEIEKANQDESSDDGKKSK
ncbi:MAG TPA: hypothetical protein VGL10_05705 [Gammaproteobacteria bacterium]